MLKKTIMIDGKGVEFKASASIPRLYRIKFRRDIMQDMVKLQKAYAADEEFSMVDLEIFENVAYIMSQHARPTDEDIFSWLDNFETFSIYEVLPEILELWGSNVATEIESKKNLNRVAGK